jgi:O-antigen ligase
MSLSSGLKPYNANGHRTSLNFSTVPASYRKVLPDFVPLFVLATFVTLTIWNTDPVVDRIYECSILLLTAWKLSMGSTPLRWRFVVPLFALALWGFSQLAVDLTADRDATWLAALRFSALGATALLAHETLGSHVTRGRFLEFMAWLGFLVSIVSAVAYYTSPGQVLWMFTAPYPDVWGPFLSRNNFAQFLELILPVALWLANTRSPSFLYATMAAVMLAAGFASASRTGAILLGVETVAAFATLGGRRKHALPFGSAVVVLAGIGGAQNLVGRFSEANPLAYRDAIYRSTLDMVASRPLEGYGLGTFALVYPRFAESDFGYRIEHAHNDWLEWASEGGLGFTAIWVWLVIGFSRRSLRHPWAWGVPALFLHSLVDYPMARIGIGAWAFILIGAIERSETRLSNV